MKNLALLLALGALLAGCPEQRSRVDVKAPPQATISAGSAAPDVLSLRRPAGPEYFGVYLGGKKAGWTRTDLTRELRGGKDVIVARERMVLEVKVEGRPVKRTAEEERAPTTIWSMSLRSAWRRIASAALTASMT